MTDDWVDDELTNLVDLPDYLFVDSAGCIQLKSGYRFKKLSAEGCWNFSTGCIITSKIKQALIDEGDEEGKTYQTIHNLPLSMFDKNIKELNFSHVVLCNEEFTELFDFLLDHHAVFTDDAVLNLSYNNLHPTELLAGQLIKLVDLGVRKIVLVGNPRIAGTHIGDLCKAMSCHKEKRFICYYMDCIQFLAAYNIHHAKTQVPYYREVWEAGYFNDLWADEQEKLAGGQCPKDIFPSDPNKLLHFVEFN